MVLSRDQSVPILYDLAMAMAGETRPRPLAIAVLQRLLSHTGSACGAVLLNLRPAADGASVAAKAYVAIGNPAIRAIEGTTTDWPAWLLAGEDGDASPLGLPGDEKFRHALAFPLPELGHLLLFFRETPRRAAEFRRLFAPILSRFARSLRHDLESEANARALAQSEARFRGMVESTSDWFWEVDTEGAYTFCNNKVMDLLGYAPEEVIGKTLFAFMPPAEAKHFGWTFRDIVANRRPFSGLENVNFHKDGREVVLETSGVPIFDADGNFCGYRGIDRDITLRKQAQEALVKAKEDAEAANRAKSLFLSSMSHELRTPLNAILGHAQLIGMQEGLPEDVGTSAGEIQQAGTSLLAQMNRVLELAGIESGNLDLQIEPVAPAEVLEDCVAANAGAARFVKSPLNCSNDCGHCHVAADRHALLQVLNQLVANAIKYNHPGGEVTLVCRMLENDRVRFSVSDEGPGIAPADQAQLFVPFNRLGAEKGRIEGAGLGLAIARRLVEGMAGSLGVDSAPGRGSTFWFELPVAAREECAGCQAPPVPAASLQGARVLVAEDYVPNQTLLRMQLAGLGCQADIVADGAAALEAWAAGRYDLILADLNMPVMDGLALTRAVREREASDGRHTPIICITAADQGSELRLCHDAGMDDALTKPIVLDALRGKLERWLGAGATTDTPSAPEAAGDAILDLACLYDILGDLNPAQGRELVATFIQSAASGLDRLAAGATGADVAQEMHKQKSSARTVGALRYAKLAATLEAAVRDAAAGGFEAPLAALRGALDEVASAFARLAATAPVDAPPLQTLADHGSLLVVDDDPVVLQTMTAMLTTLGVKEVLTAGNGLDALRLLSERNGSLEALVCDLSMPTMDGVELLRLFGRTGYRGKVILMSGADEKLLNTAGKLADLQGLHVLGQVQKPVTPGQMVGLLNHSAAPRSRRRPSSPSLQLSPQSIRDGVARDEFTVWFQPKVDAVSLKPVGIEALARWQHPARGTLSPDAFIGVAEREGLVGELSQILTSRALMDGARLHDAGFPLTIAVNLSGRWLDDLQLPDFIHATTQAAGLRPADVILEVTETGVMKELTTALDVLTRLRLKGFGLSIDDFGIGYSSFEQLDRIPFTELKLDRSFVNKGAVDATARAILQGSMDMARRMDLSTVAEGVETTEQLELVRALGCDRVQGYLIARPMPVGDLITWLQSGPGHAR